LFTSVVAIAFMLHVAFLVVYFDGHEPGSADAVLYRSLSRSIADGEGLVRDGHPTAEVPPLFPALLTVFAGVGLLDGLAPSVLNILLMGLTAGAVALMARGWFGGPVGWIAGAIAASHPTSMYWAPFVLSDPLAVALTAAGTGLLVRRDPMLQWRQLCAGGVLFALALLARPAVCPAIAAVIVWLAFRSAPRRRALLQAGAVALVASLTLVPWVVRNTLVLDEPVALTSVSGRTLWVSVHWNLEGRGTVGRDVPPYPTGDTELETDRLAGEAAIEYVREHPRRFLTGLVVKPYLMWTVWVPAFGRDRLVMEIWLTLLGTLAVAGFVASRTVRRGRAAWLVAVVALTASAAISYVDYDLRYRLPLLVFVIPPASATIWVALQPVGRLFQRRLAPTSDPLVLELDPDRAEHDAEIGEEQARR
jgi:4-amino-4-deoxy-L-arabinose transferase-like glycosyltransferase